jgi:alpha-tubulin suppressor-like RCC1 family protein
LTAHEPGQLTVNARYLDVVATGLFDLEVKFEWLTCAAKMCCGSTFINSDIFCWGVNYLGMNGSGDIGWVKTPKRVLLNGIKLKYVTIFEHACGADLIGRAYCWGRNFVGQLSLSDLNSRDRPVAAATDMVFDKIVAGFDSSCAIEHGTSKLYCWGARPIGHQFNPWLPSPLQDGAVSSPMKMSDERFKDVALSSVMCAQREVDDRWMCMGRNDHGQVGAGFITPYGNDPAIVPATDTLTYVDVGVTLKGLKANNYSVCGLDEDGKVWCWGGDDSGQLGRPVSAPSMSYTRPQRTLWDNRYKELYGGGGQFYCGLTLDDRLECWGSNNYCALARPKVDSAGERFIQSDVPVEIQGLPKDWVSVAVGAWFGCVLTTEGDVWCWGSAPSDEQPDQNLNCDPTPRKVPSFLTAH